MQQAACFIVRKCLSLSLFFMNTPSTRLRYSLPSLFSDSPTLYQELPQQLYNRTLLSYSSIQTNKILRSPFWIRKQTGVPTRRKFKTLRVYTSKPKPFLLNQATDRTKTSKYKPFIFFDVKRCPLFVFLESLRLPRIYLKLPTYQAINGAIFECVKMKMHDARLREEERQTDRQRHTFPHFRTYDVSIIHGSSQQKLIVKS